MQDIWVCSTCQSVNRQRQGRCYKCRAPQEQATGEMANRRQEEAIAVRTVVGYRSTLALAIGASTLILATAVVRLLTVPSTIALTNFARQQADVVLAGGTFDTDGYVALVEKAAPLGLALLAFAVASMLFFALWLSRVIKNVPALGGGIPGSTPARAFVTTLIPIVNLKTVPGMIQDALYRLDPKAGGFFMVALAWLGLVGSFIFSFIATRYLYLRIEFDIRNAASLDAARDSLYSLLTAATVVEIVTSMMIALGAVVLVLVMFKIESRSRARDREIRAIAEVADQAPSGYLSGSSS